MGRCTDERLINLLVWILHAAATGEAGTEVTAAVTETEEEVLICSSEFHVSLQALREVDAGIFRREVGDTVEVKLVVEGVTVLIARVISHLRSN